MSITDGYTTLDLFKSWSRKTQANDDAIIEAIIETTSRAIDSATGHQFYPQTNATARLFSAWDSEVCEVDDLWTTDSLVIKTDEDANGTFEVTWATADYQLEPLNNLAKNKAVWRIRRRADGDYGFPVVGGEALVQVTAKWGWVAVPAPIKQACLIQSTRIYNRRDTPLGVISAPDLGTNDRLAAFDPDVRDLLRPYMRYEVPL